MKKSVIILISLIYIASIAIVGFLGLKAKTYNEVIYVESFSILNDYKVEPDTGNKYIVFRSQGGTRSLKIECEVKPENASDTKICYSLDADCTYATVTEDGVLTFADSITKYVSVKVHIYSNQNPTISDELYVYFIP